MANYPGSEYGIKDLEKQPILGKPAIGDKLESPGERAVAKETRLLYEGAHESRMSAMKMDERLDIGGNLMEQTLGLMKSAAGHKTRFKNAVYEIRELVEANPDFGREVREILCPVRAIIRGDQVDVMEDDMYVCNHRRIEGENSVAAHAVAAGVGSDKSRQVGSKVKPEVQADMESHKRPR